MAGVPSTPEAALVSLFEQCWGDVRDHRNRSWQILLSSSLANTGLVAVGLASGPLVRFVLALIAVLVSSVFVVQAYKERFFELVRSQQALKAWEIISPTIGGTKVDLPFQTGDMRAYIDSVNAQSVLATKKPAVQISWFESRVFGARAWNWLSSTLILLPFAAVFALIFGR